MADFEGDIAAEVLRQRGWEVRVFKGSNAWTNVGLSNEREVLNNMRVCDVLMVIMGHRLPSRAKVTNARPGLTWIEWEWERAGEMGLHRVAFLRKGGDSLRTHEPDTEEGTEARQEIARLRDEVLSASSRNKFHSVDSLKQQVTEVAQYYEARRASILVPDRPPLYEPRLSQARTIASRLSKIHSEDGPCELLLGGASSGAFEVASAVARQSEHPFAFAVELDARGLGEREVALHLLDKANHPQRGEVATDALNDRLVATYNRLPGPALVVLVDPPVSIAARLRRARAAVLTICTTEAVAKAHRGESNAEHVMAPLAESEVETLLRSRQASTPHSETIRSALETARSVGGEYLQVCVIHDIVAAHDGEPVAVTRAALRHLAFESFAPAQRRLLAQVACFGHAPYSLRLVRTMLRERRFALLETLRSLEQRGAVTLLSGEREVWRNESFVAGLIATHPAARDDARRAMRLYRKELRSLLTALADSSAREDYAEVRKLVRHLRPHRQVIHGCAEEVSGQRPDGLLSFWLGYAEAAIKFGARPEDAAVLAKMIKRHEAVIERRVRKRLHTLLRRIYVNIGAEDYAREETKATRDVGVSSGDERVQLEIATANDAFRDGQVAQAVGLARRAERLALEGASQHLLSAKIARGRAEFANGQRALGLQLIGEVESEERKRSNWHGLAVVATARAGMLERARDFVGAFESAQRAIECERMAAAQNVGTRGLVKALTSAGCIARKLRRNAEASGLLREAIATARSSGNRQGLMHALREAGRVALAAGDPEGAASFTNESLELVGTDGNQRHRSWLLSDRADIAKRGRQLASAQQLYDQAAMAAAPNTWERAHALLGTACLYGDNVGVEAVKLEAAVGAALEATQRAISHRKNPELLLVALARLRRARITVPLSSGVGRETVETALYLARESGLGKLEGKLLVEVASLLENREERNLRLLQAALRFLEGRYSRDAADALLRVSRLRSHEMNSEAKSVFATIALTVAAYPESSPARALARVIEASLDPSASYRPLLESWSRLDPAAAWSVRERVGEAYLFQLLQELNRATPRSEVWRKLLGDWTLHGLDATEAINDEAWSHVNPAIKRLRRETRVELLTRASQLPSRCLAQNDRDGATRAAARFLQVSQPGETGLEYFCTICDEYVRRTDGRIEVRFVALRALIRHNALAEDAAPALLAQIVAAVDASAEQHLTRKIAGDVLRFAANSQFTLTESEEQRLALYDRAHAAYKQSGARWTAIQVLIEKETHLRHVRRFTDAASVIEQAEGEARRAQLDQHLIRLQSDRANMARSDRRYGNAVAIYLEVASRYRRSGRTLNACQADLSRAQVLSDERCGGQALEVLATVREELRELVSDVRVGDKAARALVEVRVQEARALVEAWRPEEALSCIDSVERELGSDPSSLAFSHRLSVTRLRAYEQTGDLVGAVRVADALQRRVENSEIEHGAMARVLGHVGRIRMRDGKASLALRAFLECLRLSREANDMQQQFFASLGLAEWHFGGGDLGEAKRYAFEAEELARHPSVHQTFVVDALLMLGRTHWEEPASANGWFAEAAAEARLGGDAFRSTRAMCLQLLAAHARGELVSEDDVGRATAQAPEHPDAETRELILRLRQVVSSVPFGGHTEPDDSGS